MLGYDDVGKARVRFEPVKDGFRFFSVEEITAFAGIGPIPERHDSGGKVYSRFVQFFA